MKSLFPSYLAIPVPDLGKGTSVKVRVLGDMLSLGRDLAEDLKNQILAANREKRDVTFIVPVGPVEQYPLLARMINEERISCRNVVFVGMDEYLDDEDAWLSEVHPLSFRGFFHRVFYSQLDPALGEAQQKRVFPDPRDLAAIPRLIAAREGVDTCYGGIG